MSGHSKWSTIKRKKAKLDAARGKVFTRIIKEITVAAREGGGDIGGNSRLRLLVEKAKSSNMPQDNITRAIKKGTGELAGASYEAARYEGYGPGGIAILIDVLTDNKNRAVASVRHVFTKYSGHLGESGSVCWMFEQKGVILIRANGHSEDDILEQLIDHDIDDVAIHGDMFHITCSPSGLQDVKTAALSANFEVESAEVEWVAKDPVEIGKDEEEKAYKLLEAVEDLEDVQNVYTSLK
jgi:YebC/PmpR family DNA-binding regulatory protein